MRIIPTRVGTRERPSFSPLFVRDHPHACGDKLGKNFDETLQEGSSPRVWGQGDTLMPLTVAKRIIPTRVGTSASTAVANALEQDHPHACGDKFSIASRALSVAGSSPRVWGQGWNFLDKQLRDRIIPTRVGTRLKKSRKIAVLQNQPLRFPLTFHRSFV